MLTTHFFPNWEANDELRQLNARLSCGYGSRLVDYRGFDFFKSELFDSYYIAISNHVPVTPERLRDVPMGMIHLFTDDYKLSAAVDGSYFDGDITARVDTHVEDGIAYQVIRVAGVNGTTIETLNQWFDQLVAGKKLDKNVCPIVTISPQVNLRVSSGSGPTFHLMEVVLNGVHNDVIREITELIADHFAKLDPLK